MLGAGLRFRGEDRFYIPVKSRKGQNQQQKQVQRGKREESEDSDLSAKCKVGAVGNGSLKDSSNPTPKTLSNLDRFLDSTKPSIPAQYFSKVDFFFAFLLLNFADNVFITRGLRFRK